MVGAGHRQPSERGAALTEFALVVPLFIAIIYGSLYLTDLGVFKLKAQEIARYAAWSFTTRPLSNYGVEELKQPEHREYFDEARDAIADELQDVYFDLDGAKDRRLPIPGAWAQTMSAKYLPPQSIDLRDQHVPIIPSRANAALAEPFSSLWWMLSLLGIGTDVDSFLSGGFQKVGMNTNGQITGRATVVVRPPVQPDRALQAEAMARIGGQRMTQGDLERWNPGFIRIRDEPGRPIQYTVVADPWRVTQGWSAHPAEAGRLENAHYANATKNVSEKAIETLPGGSLLSMLLGAERLMNFLPAQLSDLTTVFGVPPSLPEAHTFSRPYTAADHRNPRLNPTGKSPLDAGQVDIFAETGGEPEDGAVRKFESMPLYLDPYNIDDSNYLEALKERGPNFMGCRHVETRGCWE